ncbi:MAG: carbohydrate kinase family protein [bacterium]
MKYDIFAIGDTSLDVFLQIPDAAELCQLNTQDCLVCFSYADKIVVKSLHRTIGGNSANVLVGASRLGLKTMLCGVIGNDDIGQLIINTLKKEKVNQCLAVDKKQGTNYSTILNYNGERTILVYHYPRKYPFHSLPNCSWVYLSSVGPDFKRHYPKLLKELKKTGSKLAFNPGTHQLKMTLAELKPLLAATNILFVNKEEAIRILGMSNHPLVKDLVKKLCQLGPQYVCITDGGEGACGYDGKDFYYVPVFPSPRIEATGAGDAFASGVLSGMIKANDFKEALRWGPIQAAGVIQQIGPQAGYYRSKEFQKILRDNPGFKAKKI